MEYQITSITNGFEENENEVIDITGLSAGDHSLKVELPHTIAESLRLGDKLVVSVKPLSVWHRLRQAILKRGSLD